MVASASRQRRGEVERQLPRRGQAAGEAWLCSSSDRAIHTPLGTITVLDLFCFNQVSRVAPGCHSTSPPSVGGQTPRRDEQMVRQAVEIGQRVRVDRLRLVAARPPRARRGGRRRGRGGAATPPSTPPGRMKLVSGARSAFIASISSSSRSTCRGTMRSACSSKSLPRRGDVGAEVEHLVLDLAQADRRGRPSASAAMATPIARIGLVDLADRGHARARLGNAAAVDQPGAAAVAGARVDFVELDQELSPGRRPWRGSARR